VVLINEARKPDRGATLLHFIVKEMKLTDIWLG